MNHVMQLTTPITGQSPLSEKTKANVASTMVRLISERFDADNVVI